MRVNPPLKWHGGKQKLAKKIVALMPSRAQWLHYVEPYFGGGAVLLANNPHGISEVVSDRNMALTNFWRVLQDKGMFADFYRHMQAVPFSKIEFDQAHKQINVVTDPVNWAVRFFIHCRQSLSGRMREFTGVTKTRVRRGMNNEVSAWLSSVEGLPAVHARLKRVLVLGDKAVKVIRGHDSSKTLFYCLHPLTPIRTKDERIVEIQDVQVGDKLAHGKTVLGVFKRKYVGDMLSLRIQGLPDRLCVTPEHQVLRIPKRKDKRQETRTNAQLWALRELVKAADLQLGDYLIAPVGGAVRAPSFKLNNTAKKQGVRKSGVALCVCPELYRFIGYYAAEGHVQRSANGTADSVILSFCTDERNTWVADAVKCCEKAFGITPSVKPGPVSSVTQVNIYSRTIAEFIESTIPGLQPVRKLAQKLMTAPLSCQKEIVVGWLRGDGGFTINSKNRNKLSGTSSSDELSRQMFLLSMRLGLRPSFKLRGRHKAHDVYFASEDAMNLGWKITCKKFRSTRRIINGNILTRVRGIERHPYEGEVFDLDVDGDDLFAAPYVLVHNCDPPYLHETRITTGEYKHEMTEADHEELLTVLSAIKGRFLLSGYRSDLYDSYASRHGWTKHEFEIPNHASRGKTKRRMVECVWANF